MEKDSKLSEQKIEKTKTKLEDELFIRIQKIMDETKILMHKKELLEKQLKNDN